MPSRSSSSPSFSLDISDVRKTRTGRRTQHRLALTTLVLGATVALGYVGVHRLPWFGPLVADTLRASIGSENVTSLEEASAELEDRFRRATSDGEARSLQDLTQPELVPVEAPHLRARSKAPESKGPLYFGKKSPSDGAFRPRATRVEGVEIYETMLHPDPERSYAELFVYALPLADFEVTAVVGRTEPASPSGASAEREGVIPADARPKLVAAFNGGFKAEHGHYGMMSDGQEWLPPRATACTFAMTTSGEARIGTWSQLEAERGSFAFFRQTPPCMVEKGTLHPGLAVAGSKTWGATIDGETVIRRSALGLSEDGKTLFYAMSNATTARALALGMQHVGATNVAQLDVNHSYPRFLMYTDADDSLVASSPVKDVLFREDDYIGRPSNRDFFYVSAKAQPVR